MSTPSEDLDERLARLAARRAASSGSRATTDRPGPARAKATTRTTATTAPDPAAQDRMVARRPERKRRAHPAAAGRILAAGLSTSAFLSLMAAFAARAPAAGAPVVATAPPRANFPRASGTVHHRKPKMVTKVRHHTVYVDQYGRPYSPTAAAASGSAGAPASSTAGAVATPSPVAPLPAGSVVTPAPQPSAPGAVPPANAPGPAPAPAPALKPTPAPPDDRLHPAAAPATPSVFRVDVPLSRTRAHSYWNERSGRALGTTAHVVLGDARADVMAWVFDEIERLEQSWSRFRPDSELSVLNARAGEWADVSASMLLALTCAADLHRETFGHFDPTVLDALERVGYDRSFELVARTSDHEPSCARPAPGFARVEIDSDAARVRVPRGVGLDLGGVGKGLAADLVARGAIDRGARSAFVSLGGDQRARGEPPPGGSWPVPVEHPLDETRLAFVYPLVDGAIVTSSTRCRGWRRGKRAYHHIIDPATGDSSRTPVVAVVAAARDAWWAEGIAKSVMIAGVDEGVALARVAGVHALLFLDDGSTVGSAS